MYHELYNINKYQVIVKKAYTFLFFLLFKFSKKLIKNIDNIGNILQAHNCVCAKCVAYVEEKENAITPNKLQIMFNFNL